MNYDDFLNLARSRRSIRKFSRKPVTRAEIERVLEAARWAPSNHNRQPWHFIVLDEQPAIEHLAQTVKQSLKQRTRSLPEIASHHAEELVEYASLFGEAPVLVVVLHKRPVSLVSTLLSNLSQPALVSGEPLSAAMAAQNLVLAAHSLGLGTCILTAPLIAQADLAGELRLPGGCDLTCFIALGYPDESPAPPRRKNLSQFVEFRQTPHTLENKYD